MSAPRFWEQLLGSPDTPAALLHQAASEGVIPDLNAMGEQGALALYLRGRAEKRVQEAAARRQRMGGRPVRLDDPTAWRRVYCDEKTTESEKETLAVVAALLEAGARVDTPPAPDGLDALDWAFRADHAELVARLLADPTAPTAASLDQRRASNGIPWLHWAAGSHRPALVEALLAHGMNPSQMDLCGRTPLFVARRAAQAQALRRRGADAVEASAAKSCALAHWFVQPGLARAEAPGDWDGFGIGGAVASAALGMTVYSVRPGEHGRRQKVDAWAAPLRSAVTDPLWWDRHRLPGPKGDLWTVPGAYARACLGASRGVGAIHPLLQAMAAYPPQWEVCTAGRGEPERGWWGLACWAELGDTDPTQDNLAEQAFRWARRALGVRHEWSDPVLVQEALRVSRHALSAHRTRHRDGLLKAWSHWLNRAGPGDPVPQVLVELGRRLPWAASSMMTALERWAPAAGFPVQGWVAWLWAYPENEPWGPRPQALLEKWASAQPEAPLEIWKPSVVAHAHRRLMVVAPELGARWTAGRLDQRCQLGSLVSRPRF